MPSLLSLAESGLLPDWCIRAGIRHLLAKRVRMIATEDSSDDQRELIESMNRDEIAVETQAANQQHYEVPAEFYQMVLGKQLKYSCGYYENDASSLDDAEQAMLRLTCQRADLQNGQDILELGCGWGSLTLWMAKHFPDSQVTAISNSGTQREYIESALRDRKLTNVRVLTRDVNTFQPDRSFDRVVSVEMFEHLRNYRELFRRIAGWLKPEGSLFVHIFCHRSSTYLFESEGRDNWMGRYFFTGGTMPSANLFATVQNDFEIEQSWPVSGLHYWRTCEDWLKKLDEQKDEILELFGKRASPKAARLMLQRWRIFMMACAELFRYGGGEEWFVSHYRFRLCQQPSDLPRSPGEILESSSSN
jgi:cyclopropane-fatty-acyl-phospholipid synthase